MDDGRKRDALFLVAKFLRAQFPEVSDVFVRRCEERDMLPHSVMAGRAVSFDALNEGPLSGVSDDQILEILANVSPSKSILNAKRREFERVAVADELVHEIGEPASPLERFRAVHRVSGHLSDTYCLAVDRTSQVLVTGSDDERIKFWKLPEMELMRMLSVHSDVVSDLAIDVSNELLASSSHDGTVCLIEMATGKLLARMKKKAQVNNVAFSPCGRFLAAACEQGCVSIWEVSKALKGGAAAYTIQAPEKQPIAWVSFSFAGKMIVYSADPNIIEVVAVDDSLPRVRLNCSVDRPEVVFFSKRSCKTIFSTTLRGMENSDKERRESVIQKRTAVKGAWETLMEFHARGTYGVRVRLNSADVNSDESLLVATSAGAVFVWDTSTGEQLRIITHPEFTEQCSVVRPHPILPYVIFVGTSKGRSSLWNIWSGTLIVGLQSNEGSKFNEVVWSPDGQYVMSSDANGGVTVYTYQGHAYEPMKRSELYFASEICRNELGAISKADEVLVDRQGEPLLVQTRPKMEDLRLTTRQKLSKTAIADEEGMLPTLRKHCSAISETTECTEEDSNSDAEQYSSQSSDDDFSSRNRARRDPQRRSAPVLDRSRETSRDFISDVVDVSSSSQNAVSESESESSDREWRASSRPRARRLQQSSEDTPEISESSEHSDLELSSPRNEPPDDPSSELSTDLDEESSLPSWCFFTRRAFHTFVPQLGERIAYIRTGHAEWSKECGYMSHRRPYDIQKSLPEVTFPKVTDLCLSERFLMVTLNFGDMEAVIAYPVAISPPFIVTKDRYMQSIEYAKKLKVGDVVFSYFMEDGENKQFKAKITKIAPNMANHPYNSISVRFLNDGEQGVLQPWELIFPEKASAQQKKMRQLGNRVLSVLKRVMSAKENEPFVECRGLEQQNILIANRSLPVDLMLIKERLENNYYSTIASLRSDLKRFPGVCDLLGLDAKKALRIEQQLEKIIDKTESKDWEPTSSYEDSTTE